MNNIVTFSEQQGGYIDFQVEAGYYGTSALENEALFYTPNPVIGEEATITKWVEPDGMEKNTQFDDTNHAECRVDVYRIEDVNANCPPGWSVVVIDLKQYGDKVYVEVKRILYTRPFQTLQQNDVYYAGAVQSRLDSSAMPNCVLGQNAFWRLVSELK